MAANEESVNFVSEVKPTSEPSCHCCGALMTSTKWRCLSCGATTDATVPSFAMELNPSLDSPIQKHSRPTIMDGEVITYSTVFIEEDGVFGKSHRAIGTFEISVSRNRLMVHHCTLRNRVDFEMFSRAMGEAMNEFLTRAWR